MSNAIFLFENSGCNEGHKFMRLIPSAWSDDVDYFTLDQPLLWVILGCSFRVLVYSTPGLSLRRWDDGRRLDVLGPY